MGYREILEEKAKISFDKFIDYIQNNSNLIINNDEEENNKVIEVIYFDENNEDFIGRYYFDEDYCYKTME